MGRRTIIFALFFLLSVGCKGRNEEQLPVDFVWDRVSCELCKMALSDRRYSSQVIDHLGRPYYFDDIGCAILWLNAQGWKSGARIWVNDFKTSQWIDAEEANWIYGDPKTPMGYGFAATLSSVEKPLDFYIVKQMMYAGKTLVRENRLKLLKNSLQNQGEKGEERPE